jgi:uncharacterized protein (TIGR03437 family)
MFLSGCQFFDRVRAYLHVNFVRLTCFLVLSAPGWAQCINFPANLVPLASVSYVTAADIYGDHLVVGSLAGGLNTLTQIPIPSSTNQLFCGSQVPLAPQQDYAGVYVPTAAERAGSFPNFANLLVDPTTNQPYAGGVIPSNLLGQVYAFRVAAAQPPAVTPWVGTASMAWQLNGHAAVLLPTGKVLVIPGYAANCGFQNGCASPYAELYDPLTGNFTATGTPLTYCGPNPTATLLNNGQVLVVGGDYNPATAQLYDPSTGKFTYTGPPLLAHGDNHTSTLLNDGRVLITGGHGGGGVASLPPAYTNAGAETYDPATGFFAMAGPMLQNRAGHTATLLADGRVLLTGGYVSASAASQYFNPTNSAEIFDPTSGAFSAAGTMYNVREDHFAVLLPNSKVLIGGGDDSFLPPAAELFDPGSGTFTVTGSMVAGTRYAATANLLSNGQVLVSGGYVLGSSTSLLPGASTELYTPASGTFSAAGNMSVGRVYFTGTTLADGRVLVTGGQSPTGEYSSAEVYTPVVAGLVTSQTGVTFQSAPNGSPAAQIVDVLSPSTSIHWTLSVKTYSGGSWLTATPSSGASAPGAAPVPVTIKVNTAGLASQDFYGSVTLTPTDGIHPPVSITVVLSIVPAGTAAPLQVSPGGLIFTAALGSSPLARSFTISNVSSNPISFTATPSSVIPWFTISPKSGTVTSSQPATITVTPGAALPTGVYPGAVTLAFSDSSKQIVSLVLVVTPVLPLANAPASAHAATPSCTPAKLVPLVTSISSGYTAKAGWPVPVIAQIQDDCGNPLTAGSVTASFTNGDAPLALITIGNGIWSATWVPGRIYPGATIRVDAQNTQTLLSGSAQVAVQIGFNPAVPEVSAGGIVSSADYASSPALGLLVSIFGSGLADSPQSNFSLPLPLQLGSTSAFLSSGEQLPLLYVSDSLINVLIPYDAVTQTTQQIIVQHGNALSVPMPIAIFNQSPSILSADGSGSGQGHIYVIGPGGVETQANASSPAHSGDALVIYCVGLGPVTPALSGGAAAPSSTLTSANAVVTVAFGGQIATPAFAGLTPGLAGLYQINVTLPPGVTPGSQMPVKISAGAASSSNAIFMAIQ